MGEVLRIFSIQNSIKKDISISIILHNKLGQYFYSKKFKLYEILSS